MKLIGFGCSFTYGSELLDPNINEWDQHYTNIKYRESHVWLGLLAKRLGCEFDNRAQPANSNFAIGQQVAEYVRTNREHLEDIIVCIGWTERTRMSWYDDHWTHNGFVSDKTGWTDSCREWVLRQTSSSHDLYTENAKLIANSVCTFYGVSLLQFNALGMHKTSGYHNYLADGSSMDAYLKSKQTEFEKNYFASGQHPNESGHEAWTTFMYDWIKAKNIV
jgi:hypothetical protein